MEKCILGEKINNLLSELGEYVEGTSLTDKDILVNEIDKLIYECLYYKLKLEN